MIEYEATLLFEVEVAYLVHEYNVLFNTQSKIWNK